MKNIGKKEQGYRQIDWVEHHKQNRIRLSQIFDAVRSGQSEVVLMTEYKDFVRLLVAQDEHDRYRSLNVEKMINDAFTGGVYMGNPKFGGYFIIGGGLTQTTKGTKAQYIDFYPWEKVEYYDWKTPKTPADIVKDTINDERLMNQIQNNGFIEVQSSAGIAVNLEISRPRVRMKTRTPA